MPEPRDGAPTLTQSEASTSAPAVAAADLSLFGIDAPETAGGAAASTADAPAPERLLTEADLEQILAVTPEACPIAVAAKVRSKTKQKAPPVGSVPEKKSLPQGISGSPLGAVGAAGSPATSLRSSALPVSRPKSAVDATTGTGARGRGSSRSLPPVRQLQTDADAIVEAPASLAPLDPKKFVRFEDHQDGKTRVEPLARNPHMARAEIPADIAKKLASGGVPRTLARGLSYPHPWMLGITSVLLVLSRILILATLITMPWFAIEDPELIRTYWWLPTSMIVVLLLYLLNAQRTRCKVCTCHFFFVRDCHKHRNAHHIKGLGLPCSAALHLLLFRWMRCMYCGTAIRLRPPKPGELPER